MPEEPALDPELTRLAASLAGLTPATPALDRDRLFYEAGRRTRSASSRQWGWPLATALTASLAFGLGIRVAPAPERGQDAIVIKVPAPVSPPSPPAVAEAYAANEGLPPSANALRRREQVLLWDSEAPPSMPVSIADESLQSQIGIGSAGLTESQLQRFKTALSRGDI
jgi:hypothetical protein